MPIVGRASRYLGGARVDEFVAGLDLGLTKDRTALAVVHRGADEVVLDELLVWEGSRKAPVSIEAVERALLDAAQRFVPLRVVADPWQFHGSAQRLREAGVHVEEFTFGTGSVQRLSATLYRAITTGQLRVFPDSELEREVLGLVVRQSEGGWRIDHRAGGYSDRAIALALAVHAALAPVTRLDMSRVLEALSVPSWDQLGARVSGGSQW